MNEHERPTRDDAPVTEETAEAALSRRKFLTAGAGGAAALLLAGPAAAQGHDHLHGPTAPPPVLPPEEQARLAKLEAAYFEAFAEPPVISSRDGLCEATLRVVEVPVNIPEPTGARVELTRTYNGMVPGPTFKVVAGDSLRIHLINELPKNSDPNCPPQEHSQPHCFNTTNLHFHGLHVSPQSPSDDVFVEVPPLAEDPYNGEFHYCVTLPDFHKPGTHWYHAHKHGSTAIQLENGMAGALIVEDPNGQKPGPAGCKDLIFIIQEVVGQQAVTIYNCVAGGDPTPSVTFNVNGKYKPTLTARPGEVQRWRFINATGTPRGVTPLELLSASVDAALQLIAVDGIYLPAPRFVSQWEISPGNRADFFVRFPSTGTYIVRKAAQTLPPFAPAQDLAVVQVAGPPVSHALPTSLPPLPQYLTPISEVEKNTTQPPDRVVTFDVDLSLPSCAGRFKVDGMPFDPHGKPIEVKLGKTELWEIRNNSTAAHPFHIHINPFMVVNVNNVPVPLSQRFWQDTVSIPANGFVRFVSRFENFPGKFVLHCHILVHEDWGMMRAVEVIGDGYGPCQKVTTPLPKA